MTNKTHSGEFADGAGWDVEITSGRVYRAYDVPGLDQFEVCASDGVVTAKWHTLPDELTPMQAVAVMSLLLEAT